MPMKQVRTLIIDDETDVCNFFRRLLSRRGHEVSTASREPDALRLVDTQSFDVALVDLKLPDTDGISLLKRIKARQPSCEVIIMTGYSTIKTAVHAMQLGAFEYLEKPFDDIGDIEALIEKAAAYGTRLKQGDEQSDDWQELAQATGFRVGQTPEMRRLAQLAYRIASKNINVLIQGKTGTGKEVLARFLHAASTRANQAFIPVNCGALPENLLESELFGHEKGAFTGAAQVRKGIFELANRGTLFLDEIGDASPQIQVKLLRALETGEFMRVGGESPIRTDVRVISATNVDLEQAIVEKTFREDLFYRLNVVRLEIPPLCNRLADIPILAEHFLQSLHPGMRLSPAALSLLCDHGWPGNIRELANVLRRAAVLCNGELLLPEHLGPLFLQAPAAAPAAPSVPAPQPESEPRPGSLLESRGDLSLLEQMSHQELRRMKQELDELDARLGAVMRKKGMKPEDDASLRQREIDAIRRALEAHHWNITEAAKSLGIARNTLHRKINAFNLRSR